MCINYINPVRKTGVIMLTPRLVLTAKVHLALSHDNIVFHDPEDFEDHGSKDGEALSHGTLPPHMAGESRPSAANI